MRWTDQISTRLAPTLGVAAMCLVAVTVAVVGWLHAVPPSGGLDPTRRTISEYALLPNGWLFEAAVLALCCAALATLAAAVAARIVPVPSASAFALLVYGASLPALVIFPKHDWAVGHTWHGDVHRLASVVAFLSLPVAALLAGRAALRHPRWRRYAASACAFGALSLLAFAPILGAILLEPVTGVRWWRAIPLGAVERVLALCEIGTVLALAWWAARAHRDQAADNRRMKRLPVGRFGS